MVFLKPKHMAKRLLISPSKLTNLARDIESASLYKFHKTSLGSYLFQEHEQEILFEYYQILSFFGKKQIALKMFKEQIEHKTNEPKKPEWSHLLHNVIYHTH